MIWDHWRWLKDLNRFVLSKSAQKYLKNGNIFQFGRGKHGQPILYISMAGVQVNEKEKGFFIDALTFTLVMIKKYMLIPGVIEQVIVIIDLDGLSAFQINKNLITSVFDYLGQHFPNLAEQVFVFNMSQSIKFLWNAVKAFLPRITPHYVKFVDQGEGKFVLDLIDSSNLLEKYAGGVKDFTTKWPPQLPNPSQTALTEQDLGYQGYSVFTFTENFDIEIFPREQSRHPTDTQRQSLVMARISSGLGAYYPGSNRRAEPPNDSDSTRGSSTQGGFQAGQRNSFFPGRKTAYEVKQ